MPEALLAATPLLLLLSISLWRGMSWGVFAGFMSALFVFLQQGGALHAIAAIGISGLFTTLQILGIVIGALMLHTTMQHTCRIESIKSELARIHPHKDVRFFLIVLILTCFFEGVAGFGIPGALVPLILVALGYPLLLSVVSVLLIGSVVVLFGAVGAPIGLGLELPLGLSAASVALISWQAQLMLIPAAFIMLLYLLSLYRKSSTEQLHTSTIFGWTAVLFALMLFWSVISPPLASIMSALCCIVFLAIKAHTTKTPLSLRPWLPYGLLVLLLLIPSVPAFSILKELNLAIPQLFGSTLTASLRIGSSPLWAFLIVTFVVLIRHKGTLPDFRPVFKRAGRVGILLLPLLMIAQIMIYTNEGMSMVQHIGASLHGLGTLNLFLAPFLGALGTFVAGSATVSNIMLAPTQLEIARQIGSSPEWFLVLQTSGAALGNAICLYNIIAACAVVHVPDYRVILHKTIIPTFLSLALLGGIAIFV